MPDNQPAFRGLFDMFAEMRRMREHWTEIEPTPEGASQGRAWVPTVDIYADGEDLLIRCELAGIAREDVEVSLSGGQLWISGERTGAPDEPGATYYVRERRYGPFRRVIGLPESALGDQIRATVEDGLLEVRIEGGAVADGHEQIEIAGPRSRAVELDVGGRE